MTHDNTSAVMSKFKAIGAKKIHDPKQLVFALDHDIQNQDEANLKKYRAIEAFAKEHGVDFYPAGRRHRPPDHGRARICRARIVRGRLRLALQYVRRAGSGRHADRAHRRGRGLGHGRILVADSAHRSRSCSKASCPQGATGKDVIITLCGLYNHDEVLNAAVEFSGPGVASLSMDARFSISNMTHRVGTAGGLVPGG